MKVGIGLPNAVADVTGGDELTEFARRAEAQGFSSLGTIDRIVYAQLGRRSIALAAAAVVTERIELMTTVMLGPLRLNAVQTAKQALSVNQLSGGRLTLGDRARRPRRRLRGSPASSTRTRLRSSRRCSDYRRADLRRRCGSARAAPACRGS